VSEEEIMYLAIVSWLFVVTLVTGLIGLAVGFGLATIDDHRDQQPRLWPQIVCEVCSVLLCVGMIVFGSVFLAASDEKLLTIIDVILALAALVVGIICLIFIALGLMRYEYEVRVISYRLKHLVIEPADEREESEVIILEEDVYFSNN
jgi:hypothetical protein